MTYGEAAKAARRRRNLTIADLARRSGVNHATISTFERELRKTNIEVVIALADALDIGIDEYLGRNVKKGDGENA